MLIWSKYFDEHCEMLETIDTDVYEYNWYIKSIRSRFFLKKEKCMFTKQNIQIFIPGMEILEVSRLD